MTNENLPPPAGGVQLPADVVSPPPVTEEPSVTLPETKKHHVGRRCNGSNPITRLVFGLHKCNRTGCKHINVTVMERINISGFVLLLLLLLYFSFIL